MCSKLHNIINKPSQLDMWAHVIGAWTILFRYFPDLNNKAEH